MFFEFNLFSAQTLLSIVEHDIYSKKLLENLRVEKSVL